MAVKKVCAAFQSIREFDERRLARDKIIARGSIGIAI
jgi:hypothetical protein